MEEFGIALDIAYEMSKSRGEKKELNEIAEELLTRHPDLQVTLTKIFVPFLCYCLFDGMLVHAGDQTYEGELGFRIHAFHTRDHTQLLDSEGNIISQNLGLLYGGGSNKTPSLKSRVRWQSSSLKLRWVD